MPLNDSLDLTISIVSGGDIPTVISCLRSLLDSLDTSLSYEIYLIDNAVGNMDDAVRSCFPEVQIIANEQMQGFAANHNKVLNIAKGRFLLILNDDTVIYSGFCQSLVAAADANPRAGLLGPKILNSNGSVQLSAFRMPSPLRALLEMVALPKLFPNDPIVGDYRNWPHDSLREVEFLIGAALLCRREVWEQIGGLDESYYMYSEDADWCLRTRNGGWKVMLVPGAIMQHVGGKSTNSIPSAKTVETLRSVEKFQKKHFGHLGLLVYRACSMVRHSVLLAGSTLLGIRSERTLHYKQTVLWSLGCLKSEGLQEIAARTALPAKSHKK